MLSLRWIAVIASAALLAGCGGGGLPIGPNRAPPRDPNIVPPPSARLTMSGTVSTRGNTSELRLTEATGSASCSGTFTGPSQPTRSVPVTCTDGRKGTATITRDPAGGAPSGSLLLASGELIAVTFGGAGASPSASARTAPAPAARTPLVVPPGPSSSSASRSPTPPPPRAAPAAASPLQKVKEAMVRRSIANFTANGGSCPCPDSRDASGKRCGPDSAYAKEGRRAVYCAPGDITDDMARQNAELE